MKIINKTQYSTVDLRRLFTAGLTALGANRVKLIFVTPFVDQRYRGRAGIGDNWIEMLPAPPGRFKTKRFAQVFGHEVAHNLGYTHSEMTLDVRWCLQDVPWARGLQVGFGGADPESRRIEFR